MSAYLHHCPRCGYPISMQDRFCGACGMQVTQPCGQCMHEVPLDSQFCNYCGSPMPPPKAVEKLSREDQVRLFQQRDRNAFQARIDEFRAEMERKELRFRRRRMIETVLLILLIMGDFFFLQPYLEERWAPISSMMPIRTLVISYTVALLLVLVVLRFIDMRRHADDQQLQDVRTRMILAQNRMEEAQSLWEKLPGEEGRQEGIPASPTHPGGA